MEIGEALEDPLFGPGFLHIQNSVISGNTTSAGDFEPITNDFFPAYYHPGRYGMAAGPTTISVRVWDTIDDPESRYELRIIDSVISDNRIMYTSTGSPDFREYHEPGTIHIEGSVDAEIVRSTISGNNSFVEYTSNYSGGSGGAISVVNANLRLDHTTISGNYSGHNGGGLYAAGKSRVDVYNSTITNNVAELQGGGIFVESGTFIDEFWGYGYAERNEPVLFLSNTIVAGNKALADSVDDLPQYPGWSTLPGDPADPFPWNFYPVGSAAPNSARTGPGLFTHDIWLSDPKNLYADSTHNIIGVGPIYYATPGVPTYLPIANASGVGINGNQIGTVSSPIDPKVTLLGDFGGRTNTHALQIGSPAIDAGGDPDSVVWHPSVISSTADSDLGGARALTDSKGLAYVMHEAPGLVLKEMLAGAELVVGEIGQVRHFPTAEIPTANVWETKNADGDYFATEANPVLTFDFHRSYKLEQFAIWGHWVEGVDVKTFDIEFSNGGGSTWFGQVSNLTHVHDPDPLHDGIEAQVFTNGAGIIADAVRITITDNWGAAARVGLGEVRFVGMPLVDQRGGPFNSIADVGTPESDGKAIDIGAYESPIAAIPTVLRVNSTADVIDANYTAPGQLSLREAIALAHIDPTNPNADEILFDDSLGGSTFLLTRGELRIAKDLAFESPASGTVTLDASGSIAVLGWHHNLNGSRVLNIDDSPLRDFAPNPTPIEVSISDIIVTGGDVEGQGGGIRSVENLTLTDITIIGNRSQDGHRAADEVDWTGVPFYPTFTRVTPGSGGGIYVRGGELELIDSRIVDNWSNLIGGGLAVGKGSTVTIQRSSLSGNRVSTEDIQEWFYFDALDVNDDAQTGISYSPQGGGIHVNGANVTISDSTIDHNTARDGGGLFVREEPFNASASANVTLTNTTISGNTSSSGAGGLKAIDGANLSLIHATVAANIDEGYNNVGGLYFSRYSGAGKPAGVLTIKNTIIAQNSREDNSNILNPSDVLLNSATSDGSMVRNSLVGYVPVGAAPSAFLQQTKVTVPGVPIPDANGNIVGGPLTAPGHPDYGGLLDAKLDVLADNGGPTKTHALLVGSPAIDMGDPAAVAGSNAPSYDQRGAGYGRVVNGEGVGDRIDIGAYEARALPAGQPTVILQIFNGVTSLTEDIDVTNGVRVADLRVLYGIDLPYAFTIGGDDANLFELKLDAAGRAVRELSESGREFNGIRPRNNALVAGSKNVVFWCVLRTS